MSSEKAVRGDCARRRLEAVRLMAGNCLRSVQLSSGCPVALVLMRTSKKVPIVAKAEEPVTLEIGENV